MEFSKCYFNYVTKKWNYYSVFLSLHMVVLLLYMNVLNFYNSRDIPSIVGPPGVPLLFVEVFS